LKRTLPLMLEHDHVTLVDWSCPQKCGEWAKRWYQEDPARQRYALQLVQIDGARSFHKSAALNLGIRDALHGSIVIDWQNDRRNHVLLLDADTLICDGFGAWYEEALKDYKNFHVCLRPPGHYASWDLTGIVLMTAEHFQRSGGFCERIRGWGGEDVEFRLRLAVKVGLPWKDIPPGTFKAIEHDDSLRVQYYATKDKGRSHRDNAKILMDNVQSWTRRPFRELPNTYRPLLSQP
jgi:hypothetical protein